MYNALILNIALTLLFVSTPIALHSQTTKQDIFKETRIKAKQMKQGLSPTERRIAQDINRLRKRMETERVDTLPKGEYIAQRYSSTFIQVDQYARIRVLVVLDSKAKLADTTSVIRKITAEGGAVSPVFIPLDPHTFIELDCWIPFNKMGNIIKIPKVSHIKSIPYTSTD